MRGASAPTGPHGAVGPRRGVTTPQPSTRTRAHRAPRNGELYPPRLFRAEWVRSQANAKHSQSATVPDLPVEYSAAVVAMPCSQWAVRALSGGTAAHPAGSGLRLAEGRVALRNVARGQRTKTAQEVTGGWGWRSAEPRRTVGAGGRSRRHSECFICDGGGGPSPSPKAWRW
jgi:hypothetical protein